MGGLRAFLWKMGKYTLPNTSQQVGSPGHSNEPLQGHYYDPGAGVDELIALRDPAYVACATLTDRYGI